MRMTKNAPDVEDLLHTAGQQDSDAALGQPIGVKAIWPDPDRLIRVD